jgi:hypothetical protein
MDEKPEIRTQTLAETAELMAWKAEEPDGEITYHLELGTVTVHFFAEEWREFLELARALAGSAGAKGEGNRGRDR